MIEPQPPRRKQVRVIPVVVAVVVLAAGFAAWMVFQGRNSPSCSWPLRIHGTATSEQAGVVRCYLRALAKRDTAGLMAVADDDPAVRITAADLAYSPDARAGLAAATFTPSPVDDTYVLLTIAYANGTSEKTGILNMIAMGDSSSWRLQIGTVVNPGPSAPTAAGPSPAS